MKRERIFQWFKLELVEITSMGTIQLSAEIFNKYGLSKEQFNSFFKSFVLRYIKRNQFSADEKFMSE